ncbi:uncharacterized protein CC84DRAFT_403656 [Paraphaeosphaeria sporulosa]|uniref:Uncharacterized protein n=1 Tax=Paraphaeosphaeria sporulosa TaxID=1460663 RepID=A0A177BY69_9PLEO|nr:uncharacterized protein CC84DRAFT_403656 [Paraphaeosphaeria sporulosa]OAF99467.1 hypothetical protein CC84DRAFT_403656 [Paraphaeosphaeria sporulosa]
MRFVRSSVSVLALPATTFGRAGHDSRITARAETPLDCALPTMSCSTCMLARECTPRFAQLPAREYRRWCTRAWNVTIAAVPIATSSVAVGCNHDIKSLACRRPT